MLTFWETVIVPHQAELELKCEVHALQSLRASLFSEGQMKVRGPETISQVLLESGHCMTWKEQMSHKKEIDMAPTPGIKWL